LAPSHPLVVVILTAAPPSPRLTEWLHHRARGLAPAHRGRTERDKMLGLLRPFPAQSPFEPDTRALHPDALPYLKQRGNRQTNGTSETSFACATYWTHLTSTLSDRRLQSADGCRPAWRRRHRTQNSLFISVAQQRVTIAEGGHYPQKSSVLSCLCPRGSKRAAVAIGSRQSGCLAFPGQGFLRTFFVSVFPPASTGHSGEQNGNVASLVLFNCPRQGRFLLAWLRS
jgi:hypothetical protein